VDADIALIKNKGFQAIRTYGSECPLEPIGQACKKHGIKWVVGVWFDVGQVNTLGRKAVAALPSLLPYQDIIQMVVVGNEALLPASTKCSAGELLALYEEAKSTLPGCKFTSAFTIGDLQQYASTFCPVLDVLVINAQPMFAGVPPSQAGRQVQDELNAAAKACAPYKQFSEVWNTESGWPSRGDGQIGSASMDPSAQQAAINSILSTVGPRSFIMSFGAEPWKNGDVGSSENYYDCSNIL